MNKVNIVSANGLRVLGVKTARLYNDKLFFVGKKVKINVKSLIEQSKSCKLHSDSYEQYLKENEDTLFTIEYIHMYPSIGVILDTFPHLLDLSDLL